MASSKFDDVRQRRYGTDMFLRELQHSFSPAGEFAAPARRYTHLAFYTIHTYTYYVCMRLFHFTEPCITATVFRSGAERTQSENMQCTFRNTLCMLAVVAINSSNKSV